jgi:aldehyde dehydrogenase (NAD+)
VPACRSRGVALAMNEPISVVGVACLTSHRCSASSPRCRHRGPATQLSNPQQTHPLAGGSLQVFETSDLPGGVVNIVTGSRHAREVWPNMMTWRRCGTADRRGREVIELASASNMKRT